MPQLHFIRLQEVSIAVDKIVYIIDRSTTKRPALTIGVAVSTGHVETGDYGYEGRSTAKEFDLTGGDALAFLRWQNELTQELTPYVKPEPVEYPDPFLPDYPENDEVLDSQEKQDYAHDEDPFSSAFPDE